MISITGCLTQEDLKFEVGWHNLKEPYLKIKSVFKELGCSTMVDHLLTMFKDLDSIPNIAKKKVGGGLKFIKFFDFYLNLTIQLEIC